MKNYFVEGRGWFVVSAGNKKQARSVGVSEFGRRQVSIVREATAQETANYINQKGRDALRP